MVAGADAILNAAADDTKIIPGHGPMATKPDLKAFRDMLHEVQTRIETLLAAGKKAEEIAAAKPLADLDAAWGGGFLKADMFVTCVAEGIVRHRI
jgi:glyoxylase-like metal-dependent hydrolase (beta-lactamase superfamily II)